MVQLLILFFLHFCPEASIEEAETLEIQDRILRWKLRKEIAKKENKKFICLYGCGKKFADKKYIGAKKHLLACALRNKNQKKLTAFFKK